MLRRIVEVAQEGLYLHVSHGFLKLTLNREEIGEVPLADIAVLLLTAQGTTLSKQSLLALTGQGTAIVFCGKSYKPESIMVPLFGNYETTGRLNDQIEASLPLRKQLWKSIVQQKILNQAMVLTTIGNTQGALLLQNYATQVVSGDTDNREAVAAKAYWGMLFGPDFTRNPDEAGVNSFLNYGYAILRGITARAVCCAGLHPSLGIFHRNRLNNYCLVDDLIEPFRPVVDLLIHRIVYEAKEGKTALTPALKKQIYQLAWTDVLVPKGKSPLIKAVEYYAYSLAQSFSNKQNQLCIPQLQRKELLDATYPFPF